MKIRYLETELHVC